SPLTCSPSIHVFGASSSSAAATRGRIASISTPHARTMQRSYASGCPHGEVGLDDTGEQLDLAQLRLGDRVERVEQLDDPALPATIGALGHRAHARQSIERIAREP